MSDIKTGMREWIENERLRAQLHQWTRGHVRSDSAESEKKDEGRWVAIGGKRTYVDKDGRVVPEPDKSVMPEGKDLEKEPPVAEELGEINKKLLTAEADLERQQKEAKKLEDSKTESGAENLIEARKSVLQAQKLVETLIHELKVENEKHKLLPESNPKNEEREQQQESERQTKEADAKNSAKMEGQREHEINLAKVKMAAKPTARADSDVPQPKPFVVVGGLKQAAGILFIGENGKILLGQRAEQGEYQGHWGIFGGHMEEGETPEITAMREVFEETGHYVTPPGMNDAGVALPPPLQLIATSEVDGTEFSYFVNICPKNFEVALNDEHVGYQWFCLGAMPEPCIPGLEEVVNSKEVLALRLKRMHETDVAKAMVIGGLPSPQRFINMTMYKVRVTGTGHALRKGRPAELNEKGEVVKPAVPDEHVFRDKDIYLNEDFLDRCRGMLVIFDHPKKRILNSKEFRERVIGVLVQPYIDFDGGEVWGIAKVYDDDSTTILNNEIMSTSPAVVFQDKTVNSTIALNDGSTLLIEGNPGLVDHLAVCEVGVWDKGLGPEGVESESVAA